MKAKVKRMSKKSLALFLGVVMLLTSLGIGSMISASAYGFAGNNRIYFINNRAKTSMWMAVANSNWTKMDRISNTGVYTKYITNSWTGDGAIYFSGDNDTITFNDYLSSSTTKCYYYTSAFDDQTKINGTAKVISKIDSTGAGSYSTSANSSCVATISSINIPGGWSATQATSGSTGSSNTGTCYPAYGASVSYSASDSGNYKFKGFSTSNSSSLPGDATTSFSDRTSVGFNGSNDLPTVYAYFQYDDGLDSDNWEDTSYKLIHSTSNGLDNNVVNYTVKKNTSQNYYAAVIDVSSAALNSNYYAAISDSNDKTQVWNHNSGDNVEIVSNTTSPFKNTYAQQNYLGTNTNYTFSQYVLQAKPSDNKISVKMWHTNGGRTLHYQFFSGDITASSSSEDTTINYYAKDGVVRYGKDCTAMFGTTTVSATTGVTSGTRKYCDDSTEGWQEGTATKGKSITVSTVVPSKYQNYYVVGYSFNGLTPHILEPKGNGQQTYTDTWEIPEDYTYTKLEITPIYFLKDSSNTVTFYIDGYTSPVQNAGWGDTLYIYPFYQYYQNGSSGANTNYNGQAGNYRAYPGQPVVYNNGQRYTQIPLDDKGDGTGYRVKGVTINNGYWDSVHGTSESDYNSQASKGADFISTHHQTYDYDDFYKIYKENSSDINSIKFTFKYETQHQNRDLLPRVNKSSNPWTYYAGSDTSNPITSPSSTYLNYNSKETEITEASLNSTYTNGWEDFKDDHGRKVDLFGTVLTASQISANEAHPIKVISTGYQYNNAGAFGTEWIVYRYDSSASKYKKVVAASGGRTSIVPSALVLSADNNYADFSSTGIYKALDGDLGVSDYLNMYKALEAYRGYPVKITYEKDLLGGVKKDGNSIGYEDANRCDGRWTYTKKSDEIQANMKIEYTDGSHTTWTQDTQNATTGQGTVTGTKAYFTDGDATSKIATGMVLIDNDSYFNFKAATAGNYEFVGWGLENADGDISSYETMNNTSLTGKTLRSKNVTIVARFQYVTEGTLNISHVIENESQGLGTTYLGVEVDDGTGYTTIADVTTNQDDVKLTRTYVRSKFSSYNVRVTLKTVPVGENKFSSFTASKYNPSDEKTSISSGGTFFNGSNSSNSPGTGVTVTRTITFTIGNLFNNTTQEVTKLEYVSALTETVNKYVINYKYTSRLYGSKTFTKKGTFTPSELSSYLDSGTGTSKKFKASLITSKAPKESNFNEDFSWDTATAISSGTSGAYANNTYTFTINVNSVQSASTNRTATFYVPYDFKTSTAEKYYPDSIDSSCGYAKVEKTDLQHFDISTSYKEYFDTGATSHISEHGDGTNAFVTAADAVTYEENGHDVVKFFSYWKIENTEGTKEIAKCFYREFNYRAFSNYKVTAVYDAATANEYLDNYNNNTNSTTISFLGDSRNQWNDGTSGGAGYASADLIFNDFAVAFNYGNQLISDSSNNVEVGIVVQQVQQIELDSTGSHGTSLETYEANNAGTVATAISNIKSKLTGGTPSNFTAFKQTIDKSLVNNKNRTQQYVALYNATAWNESSQAFTSPTTLKNYVYRAFSYIKTGNTTDKIYVSETPAYFCMYNTAK